jgi:hypothetical protein
MGDSSITITVPNLNPEDIKWIGKGELHEKITTILLNGDDKTEFNKFTEEQINALKEEIKPAAAKFAEGEAFGVAINTARKELKQELIAADSVDNDTAKLTAKLDAYVKHDTALKNANGNLFTGGRSKRGGSKKRRGKSKRRGSKRRGSKRRKY